MSTHELVRVEQRVELNLTNLLSLVRIPLDAALWAARKRPAVIVGIVAGAALSDVLDGWFARRHLPLPERLGLIRKNGPQTVGAWLDPLCDKVFITSLIGVMGAERRLSPLALGLVSVREALLLPLFATYRLVPGLRERLQLDMRARRLGKVTTVAQFLTLGIALLGSRLTEPLAMTAAASGLCAVIDYGIRATVRLIETDPDIVAEIPTDADRVPDADSTPRTLPRVHG